MIEPDPELRASRMRHANEHVGVLVRGTLASRVGEETPRLQPGAMWNIASDVPHEARTGAEGAVVVEVRSPRRADWRQLDELEPRPSRGRTDSVVVVAAAAIPVAAASPLHLAA